MIGLGLGLGLGLGRSARQFDPAALFAAGEAGAFIDPSDLSSMFQDAAGTTPAVVGQPVGLILDKSGNDNHLSQSTVSRKPILRLENGYHFLEFDGLDDCLQAAFPISQPFDRVGAWRVISASTSGRIFGAPAATAGRLVTYTTPVRAVMHSGGELIIASMTSGTDQVSTEHFEGASSRGTLGNASYASGDAGTAVTDGLSLGASNNGTSGPGNVRIYWSLMIDRALTDSEILNLRATAATKAGVTL